MKTMGNMGVIPIMSPDEFITFQMTTLCINNYSLENN